MDDNNMYDNWSEIIAIMKTVINHGGNRAELKIAVESTLRTLGWRATTGSMKTDFTTKSGWKIDVVLGEKQHDDVFRAVLPIYADNDQPKGEDWSDFITEIMSDIDARITIVAGTTFELFFMDDVSHKAVRVAQASFVLSDKIGIQLSSLLSVSDFNEANLVDYFDSLYKENLPAKKLQAIIHSIIDNKSKSKDVLRQYLKNEGFEDNIVEEALCNVGINIFLKASAPSEQKSKEVQIETPSNKTGHDNTRFSLNGGRFLAKRLLVLNVISQYVKDNPRVTLEELESRFPSDIISKKRGVVRAWSQVKKWAEQNGRDILSRYFSKEKQRITLHDGTEIVVNTQWGARTFPRFLAIAQQLYTITSDVPYTGGEVSEKVRKPSGERAENFKFSMVGIKTGETIVFTPTNINVEVVSDDSIEYNGEVYRLSRFVRSYLPDNRRTPSNSYRGPDYFSYKGKILTDMRQEVCKEQVRPQDSEGQNDKNNKAIQISLDSYNTFKTKK